jgi:dTDP-4-dehydrorhamnose reductase
MMRTLVTGANGLVGARVAAQLSSRGHAVTALGRGSRRSGGDFEYASVDLGDAAAVAGSVRAARPEVIINAGALTDVDGCEMAAADAFRINGIAPGILAVAASEIGSHLIQVSTDYVFDGTAGPYSEDAIPNPRGVYAITKHIGEQAVRALGHSWAIARTAVIYGWPSAGRANFGSWLLGAVRKGETVRLFEDQFVSPSLADSVAEQLVEIAERKLSGVWNVCGAEVVNRLQFGQALCAEFGFDASRIIAWRLANGALRSPRPQRGGLRTDKAMAQLKNRPIGLAASLARFHQYVQAAEGDKV